MTKREFNKLLGSVPRQERFNAAVYAYNSFFMGPYFAMWRADAETKFWEEFAKALETLQAEHVRKYLKRTGGRVTEWQSDRVGAKIRRRRTRRRRTGPPGSWRIRK